MVTLLLAAAATLGSHCAAAAETTFPLATTDADSHGAHHGGTARTGHRPTAEQPTHRAAAALVALRPVVAQAAGHGGAGSGSELVAGQAGHYGGAAGRVFRSVADQGAHLGGTDSIRHRSVEHRPVVDPAAHSGSPAESGSTGLVALCVSVAVAVLLALVRLGQPRAVEVRALMGRVPTAVASLAWPSPDPVRLCVLRT